MGCSGTRERTVYNNRSNKEGNLKNQSGPFCNVNFDYDKWEKQNMDKSAIGQMADSFQKNGNNKCLGWREPFLNDKKEVDFKETFSTISTAAHLPRNILIQDILSPIYRR